jgi:hypothetical protein
MQGRKRGGQPGNANATKHGRHSRAAKERRLAEAEARHRRSIEWASRCPQTDYGAIVDQLRRSGRH